MASPLSKSSTKVNTPPIVVEPDGYYVAASSIPNAGQGLFAAKDLQEGVCFIEYTGEILTFQQARLKRDRSYMKAVGLDKHIDAADPSKSSAARYINDTPDAARRNCKFFTDKGRVYVKTTRAIVKDEEFFVDYGRGHWLYCEDPTVAQAFLSLRFLSVGGGLKAEVEFEPGTFLCGLAQGWAAQFVNRKSSSQFPDANCKLQRNPLLKGTLFVQATRAIRAGEQLVISLSDSQVLRSGLYITGFGKFQGVPENPTTRLVGNLRPYINELGILGLSVLETSMGGVRDGLARAHNILEAQYCRGRNLVPDTVTYVHFGVFAGSPCFYLEAVAHNLADFRIPDERGEMPRDTPIRNEDGSVMSQRICALDLTDIRDRLVKLGHNVEISTDAGDYICNYAYYSSLSEIKQADWGHDESLFVHVPSFDVADEHQQLQFARDLLWILTREIIPARNARNLESIDE